MASRISLGRDRKLRSPEPSRAKQFRVYEDVHGLTVGQNRRHLRLKPSKPHPTGNKALIATLLATTRPAPALLQLGSSSVLQGSQGAWCGVASWQWRTVAIVRLATGFHADHSFLLPSIDCRHLPKLVSSTYQPAVATKHHHTSPRPLPQLAQRLLMAQILSIESMVSLGARLGLCCACSPSTGRDAGPGDHEAIHCANHAPCAAAGISTVKLWGVKSRGIGVVRQSD
jgi:hypothetical protein